MDKGAQSAAELAELDILRLMLSGAQDAIYAVKLPEVRMIHATPALHKRLGLPPDFLARGFDFADYMPHVHPDDRERVQGIMARILASRSDEELPENPARYRTGPTGGPWRHMEDHYRVLRGPGGAPTMIVGNSRDATDETNAREALRQSEERFRILAENSPDVFFSMRIPQMRYEYISERVQDLHDITPQQFYDDPGVFLDCVAPEWRQTVQGWVEEAARGHVRKEYAFEVVDKHGRRRWMEQRSVLAPAPDGEGMLMLGVTQDKTEERAAREALRQSEEHYRQLVEAWPDQVMLTVNLSAGRHEYVSPSMEHVLGYAPQEFYDDPGLGLAVVAPHWLEEARGWLDELRRGVVRPPFEFELVRKDGRTIWIHQVCSLRSRQPGEDIVVQFVFREITAERAARESLRQSEERYRQMAEGWTEQVVMRINLRTGRHEYVSPSAERVFGYAPRQFYEADPAVVEAVAPEWREQARQWIREAAEGVLRPEHEYEVYDAWGRRRWVRQRGVLIHGDDGAPLAVQFLLHDVTEEKRLALELEASQERYRQLAESWHDHVVFRYSLPDMEYEYVSPSAERILGYTPEQFYTKSPEAMNALLPEWRGKVAEWMEENRRGVLRPEYEYEIMDAWGRRRWVKQHGTLLRGADGAPVALQFLMSDVTEHKRLEEDLRRFQSFLEHVIEQSPVSMWISDEHGTLMRTNRALRERLKLRDEEVVGRYNIFQDEQAQAQGHMPAIRRVFEEGGSARFELAYDTAQAGSVDLAEHTSCVLDFTISAVQGEAGRTTNLIIQHVDISEQKRAEQELRRKDALLSAMLRNLPFDFWARDMNLRTIMQSEESVRLWGDLSGGEGGIDAETRAIWRETDRRVLADSPVVEERTLRLPSGERRTFQSVIGQIRDGDAQLGLMGLNIDITERKATEEALRAANERYTLLAENIEDVIWTLDADMRWTFLTPSIETLTGYSLAEFTARPFEQSFTPESMEPVDRALSLWANAAPGTPEGDGTQVLEMALRRSGGGSVPIEVLARPLRDGAGTITGYCGTARDITQRKQAEDALRQSQERYALALKGASDGIWDWDLTTGTVYYSDRWKEIIGYGPDEIRHDSQEWMDRIHPEDLERVMAENGRCIRGEAEVFQVEYRLRHKDGSYRWIFGRGASLADQEGRVLRLAGAHTDITPRKAAEEAMRLLNERYALLVANVADVIWSTDAQLRWTFLTPSAEAMTGIPLQKLMGMGFSEVFTPRSMQAVTQAMAQRRQEMSEGRGSGVHILEMDLVRADGELLPLEVIVRPLLGPGGELTGYCGTSRDISQRKAAEEALQRSERRFSELFRNSNDTINILSAEGVQLFVSGSTERMIGFTPEELVGIPVIETMVHPDDREAVRDAFAVAIRHGVGRVQYRHRHKNGSWVHLEAWGTNQLANPDIRGVVVNVRDITDRKLAEAALQRSERLFRKLLESMHEGVWALDSRYRTIFANERLGAMLGYTLEELVRKAPWDITDPEQAGLVHRTLAERRSGVAGTTEYTLRRKDGSRLLAQVTSSPLIDDQGRFEGQVCGIVDLTGRQRLESEVRRNQARMEALYELSRLTGATEAQIASFTLEQALSLSESAAGVLFFVGADGRTLEPRASQGKGALAAPPRLPLEGPGLWGQVAESAVPAIVNGQRPDSSPTLPPGPPEQGRFLGVPALDGGRCVAVLGLSGKGQDYDEADVLQLSLLVDGMWRIVRARRDEESIRASLREKEALLREVHHRVKNNLQVVSSLLDMSGRRLSEPEARQAMAEVQAKVQAMSLIHILLYGAGDGRGIRLGEYVGALFRQLREVYGGAGLTLSARLHLGGLVLGLDQAVPLGLALNEALANVFKHAASGAEGQSVEVRAERDDDGLVTLTVRDQGPGLPPGMGPQDSPGLGMRLMRGLVVHQLGGEFSVENAPEGGVAVTLRFRPSGEPLAPQ